jgi:DNA-binding FadR family transcriptional regulator
MTNPLHNLVTVNLTEHVRIYEAVKRGDAEAAAQAMSNHIAGAAARVGVQLDKSETGN